MFLCWAVLFGVSSFFLGGEDAVCVLFSCFEEEKDGGGGSIILLLLGRIALLGLDARGWEKRERYL